MDAYYITNGEEFSRIVWDGQTPYTPPDGWTLRNQSEFDEWKAQLAPPPEPVPSHITKVQLFKFLWRNFQVTEDQLYAMASYNYETLIEVKASTEVHRDNPTTVALAHALGINTDAQIDAAFIAASKL